MEIALSALFFGLVAGVNPGPLGVFVVQQTMSRGYKNGFLASLIPCVTDIPIALFVIFALSSFGDNTTFLAAVSIMGSLYLLFMASKIYRNSFHVETSSNDETSNIGWLYGLQLNFLNPAPYTFWAVVGSNFLITGTSLEASIFVICMLATLCATKFIVACLIRLLGNRFNNRVYGLILRSLTLPMLFFAGKLLWMGIEFARG